MERVRLFVGSRVISFRVRGILTRRPFLQSISKLKLPQAPLAFDRPNWRFLGVLGSMACIQAMPDSPSSGRIEIGAEDQEQIA